MVLTNAAPLGPYRGAGRPEAIYLIERLIDGAARQHGHRPRVAAPAQLHPAEGDAVQDAERPDLRLRRVRSRDGQGARALRLEGLRQAPRRVAQERQAARHRHVLLPRGRGRHPEREGGPALRAGRQGRDPPRRAGDGAGASLDLAAHRGEAARHRRRGREADRGRQRRGAGRHAVGRVALADDGGQRVGDRLRQRDREGPARRRRICSRSRRPTSNLRAASIRGRRHRPEDADPRAGAARAQHARTCRRT